jgi:hypothetical protein
MHDHGPGCPQIGRATATNLKILRDLLFRSIPVEFVARGAQPRSLA